MTYMNFNYTSLYHETEFDTTPYADGLYELVTYAKCDWWEIGIESISILIDNYSEYPLVAEFSSSTILAMIFFGSR